ncbi:putative lipase ROG1 [Andrographis paniculata]|uniref:putative lipase ROG1 n=1 Tax=Andrographis paniculata TaxID=175694 RepID=UPI0021E923F7|nr:putative lipase ROG1 [Andrographis paniculata]
MIAVADNLVRAAIPCPKPNPNLQFTCAAVNLRLGRRERGFRGLGGMEFVSNLGRSCFGGCGSGQDRRKVEVHSASGGEDVFAAAHGGVQPDHLVIMVNGIIGSAADWRYAAKQFVKNLPDKVVVHCSECNPSRLTFDGVDTMGERLAEEVNDVIRRWNGISKISFVAHSLGGLVSRYAVGRLYELSMTTRDRSFRGRIGGLEPMNFITFATPHLGSRGHKQLPLLCGLPFLERGASQTAHWIAGRSGKHLFLKDDDDGKPPLLVRMVQDCDDLQFISSLRAFKRRVAYANANYDYVVGWQTSSIRRQNELPKPNLLLANDVKYPHIVHTEWGVNSDEEANQSSSAIGTQVIDLEEEMIRGLTQVSWERVDVSFQKSRQRYVAHTTIQVKSYWLNSDGADVVQHMIDNFVL